MEIDPEDRLEEIEARLHGVEGKLLDAVGRAAIGGRIRARLEAQLETVRQALAAIEAHKGQRDRCAR